jgi:hypothetical protein
MPEKARCAKILFVNDIFEFVFRILGKLDDDKEREDRKHIYKCLGLIENCLDIDATQSSTKILHSDANIKWLLDFIEGVDS